MIAKGVLLAMLAIIVGSALAYVPHFETEPCLFDGQPEGTASSSGIALWPFGDRCRYTRPDGSHETVDHAASVPGTLVVVALTAALFAVAVRRRSPFLRGVSEGLAFVGLCLVAIFTAVTFLLLPLAALGAVVLIERRQPGTIVAAAGATTALFAVAVVFFSGVGQTL